MELEACGACVIESQEHNCIVNDVHIIAGEMLGLITIGSSEIEPIKYENILIQSAGEFLSNEIPENFLDMEEDELFEWLEENVWEPFEHETGASIWKHIDNHARSVKLFLKNNGVAVQE